MSEFRDRRGFVSLFLPSFLFQTRVVGHSSFVTRTETLPSSRSHIIPLLLAPRYAYAPVI